MRDEVRFLSGKKLWLRKLMNRGLLVSRRQVLADSPDGDWSLILCAGLSEINSINIMNGLLA